MIAHWRFCVTCDPKRAEMNERMSRFQRFEQGRLLAQDPRGRPHIGGIRK